MTILKYIFVFLALSSLVNQVSAQIEVSEFTQESKIASASENQLYLVDFWATWCGPCKPAKEMLTVLQKQFPERLHVISISDEIATKVSDYLIKNPSQLAVAVDEDGVSFNVNSVPFRPYGVLFNAKGERLWQGHPADLSANMVKGFLSQHKETSDIMDFITVVKLKPQQVEATSYQPILPLEVKPLSANLSELESFSYDNYVKLRGSLKAILSHVSLLYSGQISIQESLNKSYEVYIKKPFDFSTDNTGAQIIDMLGYTLEENSETKEAVVLTITDASRFWDTNEIDWGQKEAKYLVSDTDITADNASLKDVAYKLADALNLPVLIKNENAQSHKPHDWQIHYKFFQFMENNFSDYGISIVQEKTTIPMYTITKKAP